MLKTKNSDGLATCHVTNANYCKMCPPLDNSKDLSAWRFERASTELGDYIRKIIVTINCVLSR